MAERGQPAGAGSGWVPAGSPTTNNGQPAGAGSGAQAAARTAGASSPSLSVVNGGVGPGCLNEVFLERLSFSILGSDRAERAALVAEMRAAGVPWEDLVDLYIPAAARRLGRLWCEDALGFADVTIGVARLQAMLRELPDPGGRSATAPAGPSIVLAVPADDYHTLGAMVAAAQLRRAGVSVRLSLGQPESELVRMLAAGGHDAVFLSASGSSTLDSLRELVERVRGAIGPGVPIVLGGAILPSERDLRAQTGVDHAVSDPIEALCLCGLTVSQGRPAAASIGS
jgi:methylmalonyl-CoA mutase cobalamin-binding subunit